MGAGLFPRCDAGAAVVGIGTGATAPLGGGNDAGVADIIPVPKSNTGASFSGLDDDRILSMMSDHRRDTLMTHQRMSWMMRRGHAIHRHMACLFSTYHPLLHSSVSPSYSLAPVSVSSPLATYHRIDRWIRMRHDGVVWQRARWMDASCDWRGAEIRLRCH